MQYVPVIICRGKHTWCTGNGFRTLVVVTNILLRSFQFIGTDQVSTKRDIAGVLCRHRTSWRDVLCIIQIADTLQKAMLLKPFILINGYDPFILDSYTILILYMYYNECKKKLQCSVRSTVKKKTNSFIYICIISISNMFVSIRYSCIQAWDLLFLIQPRWLVLVNKHV